jgi:hypothetical protein
MRFLIGNYFFSVLDSLSKAEVDTLMNNSTKGYLRLDEESFCKRHFVISIYHYSAISPFYLVVPSETGISPFVTLIEPDTIAIGFDSNIAVFSCITMSLLFKREMVGQLIYMKWLDSKLMIIAETGVSIFTKTGECIKSFETDFITSFEFDSNFKLICYTDSGKEAIELCEYRAPI